MRQASVDLAPRPLPLPRGPRAIFSPRHVSFQLALTRLTLRECLHSMRRRLSTTSTSWQWLLRKRVRCGHALRLHFPNTPHEAVT